VNSKHRVVDGTVRRGRWGADTRRVLGLPLRASASTTSVIRGSPAVLDPEVPSKRGRRAAAYTGDPFFADGEDLTAM